MPTDPDLRAPDPRDPEVRAAPPPEAEAVRGVLRGVIDPELHASIIDLGMVNDVAIDAEGIVMVQIALTTLGCPLRGQIKKDVESKVRGLPGVTGVSVKYGEMTAEQKTAAMQRARWNAREHPEDVVGRRRRRCGDFRVPGIYGGSVHQQ